MRVLSFLFCALAASVAAANPVDADWPPRYKSQKDTQCDEATRKRDGETCAFCKHKSNEPNLCDKRYEKSGFSYRCDTKQKDGTVAELWCGKSR